MSSPPEHRTEEEWGSLLCPDKLGERQEGAKRQRRELGEDQVAYLRRRCKNDLFFLVHAILGYNLLSEKLHGNMCWWSMSTLDHQYRLFLLPRNHYKSTCITIGDSIRRALPDEHKDFGHPDNLGPNIKILIAHENREKASDFLFEITAAFTNNELFMALFPELVPSRNKQRMNSYELELPRTANHKEATFSTIGVGGAAQGGHFHHVKLDDLIGEDARDSDTVMSRTIRWVNNVNSLLTRPRYDGWDMVGTFWGYGDMYQHVLDTYGVDHPISIINNFDPDQIEKLPRGRLAFYGRGMIEHDELIFPEENTWEFVEILRKDPEVFASQYANNPRMAGRTEFDLDWLQYYNVAGETGDEVVIFTGGEVIHRDVWSLDRVILTDPTVGQTDGADSAGVIVTGTDSRGRIIVLETVKKVLNPPDYIDKLYDLYAKWAPRTVSIEEVAFSAIFKYWLQEKAKETGSSFNVTPYRPGSKKSKIARVRGLSPFFSAGQIYLSEKMHDLRTEIERFPTDAKNMHLLDSLAQGPSVWRLGVSLEQRYARHREEEAMLAGRSSRTGY